MGNQLKEEIILNIDTGQPIKSIKDLRNNVKQYKDQLAQLEEGSKAYNKVLGWLTESQGKLNNINRDARNSTANLTDVYAGLTRSVAGIVSGFQVATSAASLFGVESENLAASIQKLQTIQDLVQGLYGLSNGIKNATSLIPRLRTAFAALNKTMSANPVLAVVAGFLALGAAVAGAITIIRNNNSNIDDLNASYQALSKSIDANNAALDREVRFMKAAGASEEELLWIRRNANNEYIKDLEKALDDAYERRKTANRKERKLLDEHINNINSDLNKYYDTRQQINDSFTEYEITQERKAAEEREKSALDAYNKQQAELQRQREEELRLNTEYLAKREQSERESIARREAREAERRQKFIDTIIDIREEADEVFGNAEEPKIPLFEKIIDFTKPESVDARLEELRSEAEQLRDIFTEEGLGTKEGVDAWHKYISTLEKVKNIEKEYTKTQKDESDKRAKLQKAQLSSINSFLTTASSLLGENTAAGKATAVAGATINAYLAGSQALATYPPPASFVALAATIATGLANVKNILSTNVPGASDASASSVPTPSLPVMPEVDTSAFEVYSTINPDDLHVLNDSRAVLVVEDVNQVQDRVSVAETSASF